MPRTALVIVPDEGAAEMVRAALVEAGIQPEFERAFPDHPYRASILAEPWRVFVPAERLKDAQDALARLEHDVADEADRQSRAWHGRDEGEVDALAAELSAGDAPAAEQEPAARHGPRIGWALALAFLLPVPAVSFYAGARRAGAIFIGLFVASVALAFNQGVFAVGPAGAALLEPADGAPARRVVARDDEPWRDPRVAHDDLPALGAADRIGVMGFAAKLGDLAFGLGCIVLARRRRGGPSRAATAP